MILILYAKKNRKCYFGGVFPVGTGRDLSVHDSDNNPDNNKENNHYNNPDNNDDEK